MDKLTDIKGNWNRSSTWAEYGVLTLAALVYVPSLFAWYHGDDFVFMCALKGSFHDVLTRIFSGRVLDSVSQDVHYRPLCNLVLSIPAHLSAYPIIPRTISLVVHFITGIFLFKLLKYYFSGRTPVITATLFLVGYSHAVAVLWITAVGHLLSTMFSVITLYLVITKSESKKIMLSASLTYVLALLSLEIAVTVPVIALVLTFKDFRRKYPALVSLSLVLVGFLVLRSSVLGFLLAGQNTSLYFTISASTIVSAAKFGYSFLIPVPFKTAYSFPILGLLGLPMIILLFLYLRRQLVDRILHIAPFVIVFAISSVPVIFKYASWYTYYLSIFFFLALGAVFSVVQERKLKTVLFSILLITNLASVGYLEKAFIHGGVWAKTMVERISHLENSRFTIVGLPRSFGEIPLIAGDRHLRCALSLFGERQEVCTILSTTVSGLHESPDLQHNDSLMRLSFENTNYSFFESDFSAVFYEDCAPPENSIAIVERNFLGKPTTVEMRVWDLPVNTYLYDPTELVKIK